MAAVVADALPAQDALISTVCWGRPVGSRRLGAGEGQLKVLVSEPIPSWEGRLVGCRVERFCAGLDTFSFRFDASSEPKA